MNDNLLAELQHSLENEMRKPAKKRNIQRIEELTDKIIELSYDESINEKIEESKNKFLTNLEIPEKRTSVKLIKRLSPIAVCLVVIIGLNAISLKTFGQNIFSSIYELAKGGIVVTPEISENVSVSPDDPYGMRTKLAEYGLFLDTPEYIPENFELTDINEYDDTVMTFVGFYFTYKNKQLNLFYTCYKEDEDISPMGIATDTYNVEEKTINGKQIHIVKEEKQFHAIYYEKNFCVTFFSENLDYDECYKILESIP